MQIVRLLFLFGLAFSVISADTGGQKQSPFEVAYGGLGKDGLRTIATLADGGFILGGWRDQYKPGHVGTGYLINIAPDGSVRWDKDIITNGENRVSNVFEKEDGRFVIVVEEYPTDEDPGQVVMMELSDKGEMLKQYPFGGDGPDMVEVMRETANGGYIFAGESASSAGGDYQGWIGKLSPSFDIEWQHHIGKPDSPDVFQDLTLLEDGSVIGVGMLNEHSTDEQKPARPWAAKINPKGEVVWSKIMTSDNLFALRGVVAASNGQVVLTGYSRKWDIGEYDPWIGVMSSDGEIMWAKDLIMPGYNQLIALEPSSDNRYLAVGATRTEENGFDLLLVSFSVGGDEIISYVHQKPGSQFGRAVRPLEDGAVAVGGIESGQGSMGQQLWFFRTQFKDETMQYD